MKRLHDRAENQFEASKLYDLCVCACACTRVCVCPFVFLLKRQLVLFRRYGDRHNVEVANFLKVQLMEEYDSEFTEAVIRSE